MGSPLAPVLANLSMRHYEKLWLKKYKDSQLLFYRRYGDDTFCLFRSEQDANLFFDFIDKQHPNIHFTMEKETSHVLPFLDVLLENKTHTSLSPPFIEKRPSQTCLPIFLALHPLATK